MDREQTTIRLPAELKEELQREADESEYSMYKKYWWVPCVISVVAILISVAVIVLRLLKLL